MTFERRSKIKDRTPNRSLKRFRTGRKASLVASGLIVAIFTFVALAAAQLRNVKTQYSLSEFLPTEHPLISVDRKVHAQFRLPVVAPLLALIELNSQDAGTWLQEEHMQKLRDVSNRLLHLNGVTDVTSVANVEAAMEKDGGITVGKLVDLNLPANWPEALLENDVISPALISKNARSVLFVIQPESDSVHLLETLSTEVRRELEQGLRGSRVQVAGVPEIETGLGRLLAEELKSFFAYSILGCAITIFLCFRNFSALLVPMILVVAASVLTVALLTKLGFVFNVLSSTLPILIFITVISISLHTLLRLAEEALHARERGEDHSRTQLVFKTYQNIWLPNLLGASTTCIGFLTLLPSHVPMIRAYGATVASSVMVSWLTVTIAAFPLLLLLPLPRPRSWVQRPARWALLAILKNKAVVSVVLIISLGLSIFGRKLDWTERLFDDLPSSQPARVSTEKIDAKMGGVIQLDLAIAAKDADAWNDPERLSALENLTRKIRKQTGVGRALSLADLVTASHMTGRAHSESSATAKIRAPVQAQTLTRGAVAEIYFLYGLSLRNPLQHFLTGDGRVTRLEVFLHDIPADKMAVLVRTIETETRKSFPNDILQSAGLGKTVHPLNKELSRDLIFGFWQALIAIALGLALVFKSVRWAAVACLPNLLPPLALLGYLALSHTAIKPGVALVFSIALGLSFNNTVYLLNRLKSLMQEGRALPIKRTFFMEGNPCMIATLIVLVGFSVFMGSYFSLNRTFGVCMMISIVAGLVGDLIFLPALLHMFPGLLQSRAQRVSASAPRYLTPVLESEQFKKVAGFIIATLASASFVPAQARAAVATPVDASTILKNSLQRLQSKDESETVQMVIIEADGTKKERNLEIKRRSGAQDQRVLARISSPPDVRGMAFLSVIDKQAEKQYLYLPSSKQTRRIVGNGGEQNGILGSELSYEDLNPAAIRSSHAKVLRTDTVDKVPVDVIELELQKNVSRYARALIMVSKTQSIPLQIQYFDQGGKIAKLIEFSKYKQIGQVWRAQDIMVENLINKRKTEIVLKDITLNTGLEEQDLSESALAND